MTHYIETQTKGGATIRIEVADSYKPSAGFTRTTSPTHVTSEMSPEAYNQLLETIKQCASGVIDTIQNLESLPSTASVDFAIKIDAEAGALVAKSREDAQFRIALSWKQPEPEKKEE